MELCKEYKSMCANVKKERICENFELDFQENIPQYLDDIEKVFKCSVCNAVTDYENNGSSITIYGKSIISITYLNSDHCPLSNVFEEEFSKSFDIEAPEFFNFANISLTTKYSNFRLINQRRLDIHTSLNVKIDVYNKNTSKCLSNCKNAFVKEYDVSYLVNKDSGITGVEYDETFSISNSNSQIKNIINTFGSCIVDECKIIKDKMLVKLKAEVSVLYQSENNSIEKCCHSFSVSKIIDLRDAVEDDNAFVDARFSALYIKSKTDSNNKLCDIEVVGKISINYMIYSLGNDSFITDSYMVNYDIQTENIKLPVKTQPIYFFDDKTAEVSFDCEKNVIEILDLRARIDNCYIEKSVMYISVCLSYLYYDESSQLCFFEKTEEYSFTVSDNQLSGEAAANLISYDYVLTNTNKVNLRLNFQYKAYLYKSENIMFISDIEASTQKDNANMPQLTLYFANKDESVWNIAKQFSTSMSLIMEENSLSSEVIDDKRILLVPGM